MAKSDIKVILPLGYLAPILIFVRFPELLNCFRYLRILVEILIGSRGIALYFWPLTEQFIFRYYFTFTQGEYFFQNNIKERELLDLLIKEAVSRDKKEMNLWNAQLRVQNLASICKQKSNDARQNRIKDKIHEEMNILENAKSKDQDKLTLLRAGHSDSSQLLRAITADKFTDNRVSGLLRPNDGEAELNGIDIPIKTR